MFYFHPYLGKISNLTNIYQMGWNHQLDDLNLAIEKLLWFWLEGQLACVDEHYFATSLLTDLPKKVVEESPQSKGNAGW